MAIYADRPNKLIFLEHGNAQERSSATENNKRMLMVRRIGGNVSDMDNLFSAGHEIEATPSARPYHGFAAAEAGVRRRGPRAA